MIKYRGKYLHRKVHPKIFVWSHTEKAEIEYFLDFKNYLESHLLMPKKIICRTPRELLKKVIDWKKKKISEKEISEDGGDQVWCIFDIDDFYKDNPNGFFGAITQANNNGIKIAYINECFELWVLLHFELQTSPIPRGAAIERRIKKVYKKNSLGAYVKNQKVFFDLLSSQDTAIRNAQILLPVNYASINWRKNLSDKGNPSTSIHFLIKEIWLICKK